MKRPAIGAAIAGAEVIGTVLMFGVAETVLAAATTVAFYRLANEALRGRPLGSSSRSTDRR